MDFAVLPDPLARALLLSESTVDLAFELAARSLPRHHRAALAEQLLRSLPWLGEAPNAGVHPLRGAVGSEGAEDLLLLPRRTRLVLRLPAQHVEDARALCGQRLEVLGHTLTVGACAAPRELTPTRTLYADFVAWGAHPADAPEAAEAEGPAFDAAVATALDALGVRAPWISGGQRRMPGSADGSARIVGRALVLHDLPHRHALALQVLGLGEHRLLGCGLFVPHKAITGLGSPDD